MAEATEDARTIPGPRPGRIGGNLFQINPKAHLTWTEWGKEYGPIFQVDLSRLGRGIVLGNITVMRRALEENQEIFSGRYILPVVEKDGTIGTLTWENGEVFDQRRELLTAVMERVDTRKIAKNEAVAFCDFLSKYKDTNTDLVYRLIEEANLNMISTFCFRREQRYLYDDPKFVELKKLVKKMNKKVKNLTGEPANLIPALWNTVMYSGFRKTRKNLRCFIDQELKLHQESKENVENEGIRDLIDGYLAKPGGIDFPDHQSPLHIMNIMGATTTLKNQLQWLILLITKHPDVQTKIQNEVTSVFGENTPTMEEPDKLPYTYAVIYETMRTSCPAPQLVPHTALKDTVFEGYHIAKDTVVFGNLWGIHHDLEYWQDPMKFNPDRFLNSEGLLDLEKDSYIPFGLGKRRCPGETYAMRTMVLFLVNIYQRYGFEAIDSKPLPGVDDGMIYVGLHNPPPYKLKIVTR